MIHLETMNKIRNSKRFWVVKSLESICIIMFQKLNPPSTSLKPS